MPKRGLFAIYAQQILPLVSETVVLHSNTSSILSRTAKMPTETLLHARRLELAPSSLIYVLNQHIRSQTAQEPIAGMRYY